MGSHNPKRRPTNPKNLGKTDNVQYYQVLTPTKLVAEVLRNLQGEVGRDLAITKTIIAYRQKYYQPNRPELISK